MARRTENPFLSGNFAPVADETTMSCPTSSVACAWKAPSPRT